MVFGPKEKRRRDQVWCGDIVWLRGEMWGGGEGGRWALVTEVNERNVCLDFPPKEGSSTWSMRYAGFCDILLPSEVGHDRTLQGPPPPLPEFPPHGFESYFTKINDQRAEREGMELYLHTRRIS